MGRAGWRSLFSGDSGARFFCEKPGPCTKREEDAFRRRSCEVFLFLLFLPSRAAFAAARSGPGRAAVRARRERTLTARTAAKKSVREEKNSFSTVHDVYHNGGQS